MGVRPVLPLRVGAVPLVHHQVGALAGHALRVEREDRDTAAAVVGREQVTAAGQHRQVAGLGAAGRPTAERVQRAVRRRPARR